MKQILFTIIFAVTICIQAQVGYVEVTHPVYDFLSRMEQQHIIDGFNEFELPKKRIEITGYLIVIAKHKNELKPIDQNELDDYLIEFEFDLKTSTKNYTQLFQSGGYKSYLSGKEKFLYFITDSSNFNLFVNFVGSNTFLYDNNYESNTTRQSNLFQFGGQIRGTFLNHFGFLIHATNGILQGSKSLAQTYGSLRYNFKLNDDKSAEGGTNYFDNTFGYLTADYGIFSAKIGRDRINIGHGNQKEIASNNPPLFDYFNMNINYSVFNYSYYHGKLLGTETVREDTSAGTIRNIPEKYFVYHRFNFDFSRHISISLGEIVVYSNRSVDLSYLNPFNFYKTIEHSNRDRDNSILFFDVENNFIKGLRLFGIFMIDDIDFSKLGDNWYGNSFAISSGFDYSNYIFDLPLELSFQYLRYDPYFYSHRIVNNSLANQGYTFAQDIQPNSEVYSINLKLNPHHRVKLNMYFRYSVHGANELNAKEELIRNVGGDVNIGHRTFDSESAPFLDGVKEYNREVGFSATIEPINNYFIDLSIVYSNNELSNSKIQNIFSVSTLRIKL